MECNDSIVVPTLLSDPCNGKRYDTRCIYSTDAFTLLGIEADASLDTILNAFVIALNSAFTTNSAQQIIIEDLEQRIYNLENT